MANIIPISPIALEEIPPIDGLLAGIMCLLPTLVHSLRDAIVPHVVGNIEDECLNTLTDWILYSISLSKSSYFLVVPPEDCQGNIVGLDRAWEKSMKQEQRGQGTTFERMTSVQFSSVTQSCLTICDLMNQSTPGLPVHHQLPESTQTRVH